MADERGYIRLYRKFFIEHEFWAEPRTYSRAEAWIDLIHLAWYHRDRSKIMRDRHGEFSLEFGDVFCTLRFAAERWGWSTSKVTRFFDYCHERGMITFKARDANRTVLNLTGLEQYAFGEQKTANVEPWLVGSGRIERESSVIKKRNSNETVESLNECESSRTSETQTVTATKQRRNRDVTETKQIQALNPLSLKREEEEGGNARSPKKADHFQEFLAVYPAYLNPTEKDLADAKDRFAYWTKRQVNPKHMIQAAQNYAAECELEARTEKYIKRPQNFLAPVEGGQGFWQQYMNWTAKESQERQQKPKNKPKWEVKIDPEFGF